MPSAPRSTPEPASAPGPLTTRTVSQPSSEARTETRVVAPGACRTMLARASCTIRYADRSTACGTSPRSAASDSSAGTPARTVASTSCWTRSSPGCGARSPSLPSLRSTESSRRISASDSRALAAMEVNSSRAASGRSGMRYGAESACTVITDMWWATTSCSSRAILARSSRSVRRERSASLMVSCSTSRRCASPRARTAEVSSSSTPLRTSSSVWTLVSPAGRKASRTYPATPVASHTPKRARRDSRRPSASIRAQ